MDLHAHMFVLKMIAILDYSRNFNICIRFQYLKATATKSNNKNNTIVIEEEKISKKLKAKKEAKACNIECMDVKFSACNLL